MYYNFLKDRNSWKRSSIYIGIALIISIILPLINHFMVKDINVAILNDALGLIYILLGFSYGNHMRYQYERDNASYGKKIPLELKIKINGIDGKGAYRWNSNKRLREVCFRLKLYF